jgi:hypothetical protein
MGTTRKSIYVGVRKGVHVFLTVEQGEKVRLSQIARARKAKVVFVDHIEDPMVAKAIELGGIAHDDLRYIYVNTGSKICQMKTPSTKP